MGNSLVGFKSNLNLIQSNYINWIIEAIFQDRELIIIFLIKKVYLKEEMVIIIEIKAQKMLKALKHDNKNWKRKTQYLCKITQEDKLKALTRLCT